MLNSADHEIYAANKSQITKDYSFFFLIKVAEHDILSANKYGNANYCWYFRIYKQRKIVGIFIY